MDADSYCPGFTFEEHRLVQLLYTAILDLVRIRDEASQAIAGRGSFERQNLSYESQGQLRVPGLFEYDPTP